METMTDLELLQKGLKEFNPFKKAKECFEAFYKEKMDAIVQLAKEGIEDAKFNDYTDLEGEYYQTIIEYLVSGSHGIFQPACIAELFEMYGDLDYNDDEVVKAILEHEWIHDEIYMFGNYLSDFLNEVENDLNGSFHFTYAEADGCYALFYYESIED